MTPEKTTKPENRNRREAPSFPLGTLFITRSVNDRIHPHDIAGAVARHARGDWGELDPEDREENDRSLREGDRLLSVYRNRQGTTFWVVTEADRSATTVLLPEDYSRADQRRMSQPPPGHHRRDIAD